MIAGLAFSAAAASAAACAVMTELRKESRKQRGATGERLSIICP